jgi:hypothetical protein
VAEALMLGARRHGWSVDMVSHWSERPRGSFLAAYGWKNLGFFETYRAAGLPFVYVDLGYWQRKRHKNDYSGFYKVVVNARHATEYFRRNRPHDRTGGAPRIEPWRKSGEHIVLAGLSAKSAAAVGLKPLEWETRIIEELAKYTSRPIIYRPKPSWKGAQPIPGMAYSPRTESISVPLARAWALVTLHSNAALDALAAGVPIYAPEGVASVMSMPSLANIETPEYPEGREQLFADIGYLHWTLAEMTSGKVWAHLKEEGFLPCE